jgi:hypothetical protein
MQETAVGGGFAEPPTTGCWCCGDRTVSASLLQLNAHPEVGICFPAGWPSPAPTARRQDADCPDRQSAPIRSYASLTFGDAVQTV